MRMIVVVLLLSCALLTFAEPAQTDSAPNLFDAIALKNAFRLNPAKPQATEPALQIERPQITLVGITTIFGYAQALLVIQPPAKLPVTAPVSCVLAKGESLHDVLVLEISVNAGTVSLNNSGLEQALALKR